jgi:Protein of unknown function (DUF2442)
MSISPKSVRFDEYSMWVELQDGRTVGVPLSWFPRLMGAPKIELEKCELSAQGLHWELLDEDISVAGLLMGQGDISHRPYKAA